MSDIKPSPYSKDYEITDAMFGAFRSSGGMRFFWTLFLYGTLFFSVFGVFLFPAAIETYVDLIRITATLEETPTDMNLFWGAFLKFWLVWGGFMLVYVGVVALTRAAFFRGYFFDQTEGNFPIQFGQDEIRQALAILGFIGVFTLVTVLATVVMIILIVASAALFGESAVGLMVVLIILLYLVFFVGFIWVGVRFCCAGALTALRQKTHVLAARTVSLNRFWALFGSILVAGVIGYAVAYAAMVSAMLIAFAGLTSSDMFQALMSTDLQATLDTFDRVSASASFKTMSIVSIVLVSAGYSFYTLILAGPQAFFTRQWAEASDEAL